MTQLWHDQKPTTKQTGRQEIKINLTVHCNMQSFLLQFLSLEFQHLLQVNSQALLILFAHSEG